MHWEEEEDDDEEEQQVVEEDWEGDEGPDWEAMYIEMEDLFGETEAALRKDEADNSENASKIRKLEVENKELRARLGESTVRVWDGRGSDCATYA